MSVCKGGASGQNSPGNAGNWKRCSFDSWVRKIRWKRAWQPTPGFLPGESCGQRSLVGYSQGTKSRTRLSEILNSEGEREALHHQGGDEGQGILASCSRWGHQELDTT